MPAEGAMPHTIDHEEFNRRVHSAVRNDWVRFSNTVLLILISIVVSLSGWTIGRMASRQDT